MLLRPRQKELVTRTVAALNTHGNTLAVAPTGAGKTIMLSAIIGEMFRHRPGKACVLAHRDELTFQNEDKFRRVNPGLSTSVFDASVKSWNGAVTFAMVQTLSRENNLSAMPPMDILVIDEAHHARAESYMRVIERVKQANFRLQEQQEGLRKEEERRQKLIEEIKDITEENISAQDKYNTRMEELNKLLKEGAINFEEFQAAAKKAYGEMLEASDKWFDGAKRALNKYAEEATDMAANVERVVSNAMQTLEDTLVKAATTGKFEFKDMVNSIAEDIARLLVRTQITGPLAQGLSGMIDNIFSGSGGGSGGGFFDGWFAKGAAFADGQKITAYARGGIVGRPTLFPMAKGMGLMGEAGPEAVLPLTRTSSGRLGVEAIGGTSGGNLYTINVDARGSTDPAATSESVRQAVDEALNARIPGIVQTSVELAHRKTVDSWQRRGSRFE